MSVMEGRTKGGHFDEVLIDHERAIVHIEYPHWKIHIGELFFIADFYEET